MPHDSAPPVPTEDYNQTIYGYFGEFGSGGNAQCVFIQTGLCPSDLGRVSLVSEIPGSEKWPVRDLFQREVEEERVSNKIIPYINDPSKVKFFNPLTLTLLPVDLKKAGSIVKALPTLAKGKVEEGDREWSILEYKGFYRFRCPVNAPQYGRLEWNDKAIRLVAIDGQHRLSALKRTLNDPQGPAQLLDWTVPAVIFGLNRVGDDPTGAGSILDFVRNVFVYINSTARQPNRARTVLLSDEDINHVCVQELLQSSHSNDVKEPGKREPSKLPLLFFDWRGLEEDGRRTPVVGTMYTVEEIDDWFEYYLLGQNFSIEQESALRVRPTETTLKAIFAQKRMSIQQCEAVRTKFRSTVLPGIEYFLQNFRPLCEYVAALRKTEESFCSKGDIYRHAFHDLRFGCNQASDHLQPTVQQAVDEITSEIHRTKTKMIKEPLRRDVGIRGVVCAFGELRTRLFQVDGFQPDWLEYAKWFTENVNAVYDAKWIDDTDTKKREHRLHVTHDHNDVVANYRLNDVKDAFGAYLAIVIAYMAARRKSVVDETFAGQIWDAYTNPLFDTIQRGYRKQWRPQLKEKYPLPKELNAAVKKKAEQSTTKQLERFAEVLQQLLNAKSMP